MKKLGAKVKLITGIINRDEENLITMIPDHFKVQIRD